MIFQDGTTVKPFATGGIIGQIIAISLAMVAFSQILRWKFRLSPSDSLDLQHRIQGLQEELKLSQAQGNRMRMQEIQVEMMEVTKEVMKKQLVPTCISSIMFMVILGVLSSVYGKYDYSEISGGMSWLLLYFIVSFGGNILVTYLIKQIKKARGIEEERPVVDNIRALQRNLSLNTQSVNSMQLPSQSLGYTTKPPDQTNLDTQTTKDWKKKLQE